MDEAKQKAIRKLSPKLESVLVLQHLKSHLHKDAGGFLTDREADEVVVEDVNYKQMHKLLEILVKKNNEAFISFCCILASPMINQEEWAVRLMEEAGMSESDSCNLG